MDESNQNVETTETGEQQPNGNETGSSQQPNGNPNGNGDSEKLKQEYEKKLAAIQKELDDFRKSKMTEDEAKQYEIKQQEQQAKQKQLELEQKQAELTERENRYFALETVNNLELGVKGDLMNQIVDLVMADTQDKIKTNVKALETVVNQLVKSKVNETFKANGRQPGKGTNGSKEQETSIGAELGKRTAAADKAASDTLKHYI
ncbi:MAG: DUF4355 domain-containing protein [Ruminococcus sp.]|nr:DUF4355 domain-containing protein [Ruminococcus sp.]